jgi:hypothetical protein
MEMLKSITEMKTMKADMEAMKEKSASSVDSDAGGRPEGPRDLDRGGARAAPAAAAAGGPPPAAAPPGGRALLTPPPPPPRFQKLDFPRYDSKTDPMLFINKCESYFRQQRTSAEERVWMASYNLEVVAQFWYIQL